jgi:diadenosine tetraphosphate (Ap4A) HIT family hydrolase
MSDRLEKCLFCDEIASGENLIIENDLFRARWDQIPLNPGHAEVVPKRHVQLFEELTDEELQGLLLFAREVIQIIKRHDLLASEYERLVESGNDFVRPHLETAHEKARLLVRPPDAFNHGINDGVDGGQTIPHLHYHLIPRWKGDVENPRGGIRRMFGEDDYSNGGIKPNDRD